LRVIRGEDVFTPESKEVLSQKQQYARAHELQKKSYNLAARMGQESKYINLLKDFIHSMEISLKKTNETGEKENIDEIQTIANPIYVKPRGRPPQKRYKSALKQQHNNHELDTDATPESGINDCTTLSETSIHGNLLTNPKHSLSDENCESNNSKRMKKCGRCKRYAMHNRRTCDVDLQQN